MAQQKATRRPRRPRTVREELSAPVTQAEINETIAGVEAADHEHEEISTDNATTTKSQRLSLPLTDDGTTIDWERVRNPEKARSVLGLNEPTVSADGLFGADMLGLALDMLSSALVSVARAGGYTAESSAVLKFSADEKAALIPRAAKVLGKHSPALGRWEDEIMLAVTASMILGGKLMSLKKAATVATFPRAVQETREESITSIEVPTIDTTPGA